MDAVRSRKAKKVLYLYLTIPLLILTAVFGMIALMTHAKKRKSPEPDFKARPMDVSVHADAGSESAGSAWSGSRPSIELPPLDDDGDSIADESAEDDKDEADSPKESTAGTAAIITAIMGGLTGLMGAMTQTFIAFMKVRDRRRNRSDEEESSDDQEQS